MVQQVSSWFCGFIKLYQNMQIGRLVRLKLFTFVNECVMCMVKNLGKLYIQIIYIILMRISICY